MSEEVSELKRALGLGYTTLFGVGLILGAGIYALIGRPGAYVGDAIWLSVLFATFIALLTGLSYAEFASMFPKAASSHTYVRETFPGREEIAFLSGWLITFEGIAGAATAAVGFAGYFVALLGLPRTYILIVAVLLLALLTLVNWWGVKESAVMIAAFTAVETSGLIFVALLGFLRPTNPAPKYLEVPSGGMSLAIMAVLAGAALFYFAFTGFELQPTLAEEAKNPKRTVPIAIILALLICSALYLLVAISVVRLMPGGELAAEDAPLAAAARRGGGDLAYYVLAVVALFSTSNTVLGFLVSSSRLIYGLADEGIFPEKFKRVHHATRTPHYAVFLSGGIAILVLVLLEFLQRITGWYVIILGEKEGLLGVVGMTASLACLMVFVIINISVVVLRIRKPDIAREFRIPTIVLPIIGAIITTAFIIAVFMHWVIWITTAVIVGIGCVLYYMRPRSEDERRV